MGGNVSYLGFLLFWITLLQSGKPLLAFFFLVSDRVFSRKKVQTYHSYLDLGYNKRTSVVFTVRRKKQKPQKTVKTMIKLWITNE